jgi:hypothetical protein
MNARVGDTQGRVLANGVPSAYTDSTKNSLCLAFEEVGRADSPRSLDKWIVSDVSYDSLSMSRSGVFEVRGAMEQ